MLETRETVDAESLAKHFGVGTETVLSWARRWVIPSLRPTKRTIRFDPRAVEAAILARQQPTVEAAHAS